MAGTGPARESLQVAHRSQKPAQGLAQVALLHQQCHHSLALLDGDEVHQRRFDPAAQAAPTHGRVGAIHGPEQGALQLSIPLGGGELQVAAGLGIEHQGIAAVHDRGHLQGNAAVVFEGLGVLQITQQAAEGLQGQGMLRQPQAIEAAEAAVRSPLLEDIDISGAKGLLVNIAAGLDITLTEFSEVGSTVEDFASENATVVIGTVIDPAMGDEMRVTVVATGLGLDEDQKTAEFQTELRKRLAGNGVPDYGVLDKPTVIRNKAAGEGKGDVKQQDLEYLDIPAFLRRQAD